ncbi:MAG: GWxTD domain-containing protein [Bacteroidales bacterium]|nr:GWxTD domain-containing protein [Bacteroidales bacterium]
MVKVFPVELLFSDANEDRKLIAKLMISFRLTDITDRLSATLADSGTYNYIILKDNVDKRFFTQIPLKAERGKIYELRINAVDKTRKEENIVFIMVDKSSRYSLQNFRVKETRQNLPLFEPFVTGDEPFRFDYHTDTFSRVFISYYGQESPLPRPSFSLAREREFMEKPDSLWILSYKKNTPFQLGYEGIYHFQFDTTIRDGLTVFNFGPDYPRIRKVQQMIEPLAYLTSTVEYDKLKKSVNQKLAVDNFWLGLTKNDKDRARELIRVYYNRVYFANYYFTTFKPGWKTDRGMIYIIYGPPQAVAREPGVEKWIYYKNNFATSLTFTFTYTPSSYALNNFILQRSESYDTYWRQAVDAWQKGTVFMLE